MPIVIQLVNPEPVQVPAMAQPTQAPRPAPRPLGASKPRPEAARPASSSEPKVEQAIAIARTEPAKPRPSSPTKPQPVAAATSSDEVERRSVASARPAPAKPVVTEVFSREPAFLTPPRSPVYPAQARRRNQQGQVLVEVRLDAQGRLLEARLLRSSGVESLDRSALDAVAGWRFRPETQDGQPVPSRVHIPIEFALSASR
ncbi:energy transducer TonB [Pseudomonas sp. LFM046]|uniref:energy transducer TonB n=1 Tax=Pseudomonas sp. LFM046 TaxID=1608357 RepID=UPI0013049171|nr:energy transducer TonB [Pseudomonas sp. LFM046]